MLRTLPPEFYSLSLEEKLNVAHTYLDQGRVRMGWLMLREAVLNDRWGALSVCDNLVDKCAHSSHVYLRRGRVLVCLELFEQAVEDFSRCIALDPRNLPAYNNRGNAHHRLGQYEKSIQDYSRVIEMDSEFVTAYINRGLTYSAMGKTARAMRDFTRAIEIDPSNAKAYWNRGLIYKELGERKKAMEDKRMAQKCCSY